MTNSAKASPAEAGDNETLSDDDIWAEFEDADVSTPDEQTDEREAIRQVGTETEDEFDEDDPDEDTDPVEDASPDQAESEGDQASEVPDGVTAPTPTLEDLQAQNQRLELQFKSEQERAVGQQRRAERLQRELDELKSRLNAKTEDTDDLQSRLAALKEDYGDVVGPLVDELNNLKGKVNNISAQDQVRIQNLEAEISDIHSDQIRIFEEEHPDGFASVAKNAALFREWIKDQPRRYWDMFDRNRENVVNGLEAAIVVSRFKRSLAEADAARGGDVDSQPTTETVISSRRQAQLGGAQSQRSQASTPTSGGVPSNGASEEEMWAYWDRLDSAG